MTFAERALAQRIVRGMLEASCRALEPAWRLGPWGTWEPNDPPAMTGREIDASLSAMPSAEIEALLAGRTEERL